MKTSVRRLLAATTSAAVMAVGALAVTPTGVAAPSPAAKRVTNFAFHGWSYGTKVKGGPTGLSSSPTAYAWVGCTRKTGVKRNRELVGADVPNPSPALKVGAVTSHSRTYRSGGKVGMRSTNKVASIRLGLPGGGAASPNITIKGLATTADAYSTKGKFGTRATFTSADISANTGTPLDDLLNPAGAGIGDLLQAISKETKFLEIPGLGRLSLGRTIEKKRAGHAFSRATALQVLLYGPDGVRGGDDDVNVVVGRSYARIAKNVPSGVMVGRARAIEGSVLGDTIHVGPVSQRILPCEGTDGVVKKSATVGANLLNANAVLAGVAQTRVRGEQLSRGRVKAWTEASIADIKLGVGGSSLRIKGIVGRAKVRRTAKGKFVRSTKGSRVASITFGGKTYAVPNPGQALEIPGVLKIQTMVKSTTKNSIKLTALRVTVLGEQTAVLNLGVAKTRVRKS